MNQEAPTRAEIDELLKPPTEEEAIRAVERFAAEVRRHYGGRLKGIFLFGSRARQDHSPESDADVAIVLKDADWEEWVERHRLVRLAYRISMDTGLAIQPWPFSEQQWTQ